MPYVAKSLEERLSARLDRSGDCWIDTSGNGKRYGKIKKGGGVRKDLDSHVAAYLVWKGDIPKGMLVCHTCDVPRCCNPDHLYLGTAQDNANDRMNRGRHWTPRGEEHPLFKHGKYSKYTKPEVG